VVTGGPLEIGMGTATLTETGRANPVLGTDRDIVRVLRARRRLATAMAQIERENDITLRPTEATK
jgi:hypothetical protein